MKFSNTSLRCLIGAIAIILLAGCASKPERKVRMPSWVDIYDSSDREKDESKKDEEYSPESAADASDRLSEDTSKAEEKAQTAAKPEEKKSSSLFDFFWNKKEQSNPEEAPITDVTPAEQTAPPSTKPEPKVAVEKPSEGTSSLDSKAPVSKTDAVTKPVEPAISIVPKPKALAAKSEQHALEAKQANSDYQRALKAMKAGNQDDALLLFQELNGRYPTLSGPIVNQAIILRKQGKLDQAKALLQKAILNKTQNPYLMNELGLVNRALGKFEAAKQSYLSAIRLEPNYDKAHYNLGVLADLYLHDPALAFLEFEAYQALQEKPNKKVAGWLKEIKRRIK